MRDLELVLSVGLRTVGGQDFPGLERLLELTGLFKEFCSPLEPRCSVWRPGERLTETEIGGCTFGVRADLGQEEKRLFPKVQRGIAEVTEHRKGLGGIPLKEEEFGLAEHGMLCPSGLWVSGLDDLEKDRGVLPFPLVFQLVGQIQKRLLGMECAPEQEGEKKKDRSMSSHAQDFTSPLKEGQTQEIGLVIASFGKGL